MLLGRQHLCTHNGNCHKMMEKPYKGKLEPIANNSGIVIDELVDQRRGREKAECRYGWKHVHDIKTIWAKVEINPCLIIWQTNVITPSRFSGSLNILSIINKTNVFPSHKQTSSDFFLNTKTAEMY